MKNQFIKDKSDENSLVDSLSICGHIFWSHERFYFDIICTICQKSFTKYEDFVGHIISKHTTDTKLDVLSGNETFETEELLYEEAIEDETLSVGTEKELYIFEDESIEFYDEDDVLNDGYSKADIDPISKVCSITDPSDEKGVEFNEVPLDDYDPLLNETRLKIERRSSKDKIMADFVDLYHKMPFLWKKNLTGYRNKKIRHTALKVLLKKYKEFKSAEVNILSVQEQIDALRKRFAYIHKKMSSSVENFKEPYVSTWPLFDKLMFLSTEEFPKEYDCTFCKIQISSWKKLFEHMNQNHVDDNSEPMHTFDKNFSKEFIKLYKNASCLWDSKSSEYKKKDSVLKAYEVLITKLREVEPDANRRSASKKIAYYRTMFRQQYKRIEIMRKMNKKVNLDNFEFYKQLKFLIVDGVDEIDSEFEEEEAEILTERLHACPVCDKSFTNNSGLRAHLETHNERSVKCESCNRCFKSQARLLNHMILHTGDYPYHCETCGKGFQRVSGLRDHKYVHLPPEMRPFECKYCGVKISNRQNFTIHVRRHTKEYRYHCEICKKGVITKTELHLHMRTHSDDKPFVCHICGASYKRRNVFSNHMKKHTGIRDQKCTICEKSFFLYRDLKDHLQTHKATKDFACDVCGAAFHTKTNLKQHQLLHLPNKKYICKICNSAFAQRAGLHSHMKSH